MNIGSFRRGQLPFRRVKVAKENGERVIEGVFSFVDLHPDIPWGRMIGEVWTAFSKEERSDLIEQKIKREERAAKKAAKVAAGWVEKPRKTKEGKITSPPRVFPKQPEKPSPKEEKRLFAEECARLVEENSLRLQAIQGAKDTSTHLVKRGGIWTQVGQDNLTAFIENR